MVTPLRVRMSMIVCGEILRECALFTHTCTLSLTHTHTQTCMHDHMCAGSSTTVRALFGGSKKSKVYTCICTYTRVYVYSHTYVHVYSHTYVYVYMYIHIHMYKYTYARMHA